MWRWRRREDEERDTDRTGIQIGDEGNKVRKRRRESKRMMEASGYDTVLDAKCMSKLMKELRDLQTNGIDGVKVIVNEESLSDIQAEYTGPEGTPFEGGVFRMKLMLGPEYPNVAPKGRFITKIFHPNVSSTGDICVNVLKRDWKPDMGLWHIFTVIRCRLVEPNPESALNEEAGKLLLEGFDAFDEKARMMTEIHAMRSKVLTAAGGANALNSTEDSSKSGAVSAGVSPSKAGSKTHRMKSGIDKKRSLRRL